MPGPFYPQSGALEIATVVKAHMALSKVRLLKEQVATDVTVSKADLEAKEADYDGYAEATITAFQAPYLDPNGGATTSSGYNQFDYGPVGSPPVTNNIWGFWVEDAAGLVILVVTFSDPLPMNQVGDSVPVSVLLNYGA